MSVADVAIFFQLELLRHRFELGLHQKSDTTSGSCELKDHLRSCPLLNALYTRICKEKLAAQWCKDAATPIMHRIVVNASQQQQLSAAS